MTEDRMEFAGFLALMAIVMFSLTPAFWQLIAFLGQ
jgi:hypothetical protein